MSLIVGVLIATAHLAYFQRNSIDRQLVLQETIYFLIPSLIFLEGFQWLANALTLLIQEPFAFLGAFVWILAAGPQSSLSTCLRGF